MSAFRDIAVLGFWRYVYLRFAYRFHMRVIHRYGGHWRKYLAPYDGPAQLWCQWCGDRWINVSAPAVERVSARGEQTPSTGTFDNPESVP